MLFYKVTLEADQVKFNSSILIANELWTEKELLKAKATSKFKEKYFTKTHVSKRKVYWFFGARFGG